LRAYFSDQIAQFQPRIILLSTDDPAQMLLELAVGRNSARVVYLTRTTLALPFGPEAAFPSEEKTELLRSAEGVVGVSEYVADYIRKWSGINAKALPISLLEDGPWPELGRYDNEFVTFVNPCAVKGISIFLALAERLPDVSFAAVPTWGTTAGDLEAMGRLKNIHILDPVDDIDDLLRRSRVVLVPSLWAEARSRIIVEAMLRGVPVLASNIGGIPEAKMGVDYLLPVNPIKSYEPRVDDQMVPVARVPEQDSQPWLDALSEVIGRREYYEALSEQSRKTALKYARGLSVEPFENFLSDVVIRPRNPLRDWAKTARTQAKSFTSLETLSPEKRALLALRLRKSPGASQPVPASERWFPNIEQTAGARLRLFCFPYAGGGASVFRNWGERMPDGVAVVPVRLPGRESRTQEQPVDRIGGLVDAVVDAIQPYIDSPFALFGHSMGAMIGFELARCLRRRSQRLPAALLVAAARAPQFRKDHVPSAAPSEEEFLREIRELEGAPREVLENEELLKYLLPALKADSMLGRMYVYHEEPPLDIPIRAYVGAEDKRLPIDVIEAWKQQTTRSFALREFPGGHFFVHTEEPVFLDALADDLARVIDPAH
jgi:surfactin synthase thioesterase subunit